MKIGLLLISLFSQIHLFAQAPTDCKEWKLKYESGTYKMYMRECAYSPIKEVRVLDKIKCDFKHLQQVMEDIETAKKMVESCKDARVLEQIDRNTSIEYYSYKMPVGVKDRDIVTKTTTKSTDSTYTYVSESVGDSFVELKSNFIRIKNARSSWFFKKFASGIIEIEYHAFADPNGDIPSWLINWLARNEVRTSILKLKKLVNN